MTSLWTPYGEKEPSSEPEKSDVAMAPPPNARGSDARSDEDLAADLDALQNELLSAPAGQIIANHCYGLFQLAALYLAQNPPRLDDARLAIDALGAVIEQLGPRLGDAADALREGLSQVRLAFVEIAKGAEPVPSPEP